MSTHEPYDWTVMIYLAGNNSLGEDCVAALMQMAEAKISDNIAVFAQLNTGIHDSTTLRITSATTADEIHDKLNAALAARERVRKHADNPETERGHSHKEKIFDFVECCLKECNAKRKMLVLSGHGDGVGAFLRENGGKNSFTVINFGQLIERINKELLGRQRIDILGLDS